MFRFVTENNDDVVNRFMLDSASYSLYIPFYLRCIRERDFALARALWDKIISTAEASTVDTFVRFPIFLPTGELSVSNKYVWDGVKVYSMDVSRMKVFSSGDCRRFSLTMLMAYNTCVDIKNGWLTGVQVDTRSIYDEYVDKILTTVPSDLVDDTERDAVLRALKATCEMLEV